MPQPEKQLDLIKVTGLVANVERAKLGLLERVKELQAEQEDRVRNRVQQLGVNPKCSLTLFGSVYKSYSLWLGQSQNLPTKRRMLCQ